MVKSGYKKLEDRLAQELPKIDPREEKTLGEERPSGERPWADD